MKKILHRLFYGELDESERSLKEFQDTKEFEEMDEAHEALQKTMTEEQKELFDAYFLAYAGYLGLDRERTYINGFKTGFWLAFELMDFDI